MRVSTKRGIVILATAALYVVYRVIAGGIAMTGSGGLGAMSVGLSEAQVEGALLAAVAAVVYYGWRWWQRRRSRARGVK